MGSHDHEHEHQDHCSSHDHKHGHEHGNEHEHEHEHEHDSDRSSCIEETKDAIRRRGVLKRLYQASFLCTCFIIVEVVGGLISHSLAILSDAAHLFADLASFGVAIAASYLASMPATREHTYGLKRTESLAALFSMVSLAFVSVGLGYEAVNRLIDPPEELVQGKVMSGIASIGVLVNIALAVVLGEDHVHLPGAHDHDHQGHSHGHDHDHGLTSQSSSGYELLPSYQKQHSGSDHPRDHDHDHAEEGRSHGHANNSTACNNHNDGHYHDHDHGHGHQHDAAAVTCKHEHVELHDDEVALECPSAEDERNINLRAAYLHVMADLAQSVAVLIAGLIIWARPDWYVIDPILTLLFAVLVLYSTVGVLRSSIAVLLEATPPNISWHKVYKAISQVPNVTDVHDLHLWSISHGQPSLSVHCRSDDPDALRKIRDKCQAFGISHVTIQIQPSEGPCITCDNSAYCTSHLA